jgi:hypothetical protein
LKDGSDNLDVRATGNAFIARYTSLINRQVVAAYTVRGLTTQALSGRLNQQQGIPQVSLVPWRSYLGNTSEGKTAKSTAD